MTDAGRPIGCFQMESTVYYFKLIYKNKHRAYTA